MKTLGSIARTVRNKTNTKATLYLMIQNAFPPNQEQDKDASPHLFNMKLKFLAKKSMQEQKERKESPIRKDEVETISVYS